MTAAVTPPEAEDDWMKRLLTEYPDFSPRRWSARQGQGEGKDSFGSITGGLRSFAADADGAAADPHHAEPLSAVAPPPGDWPPELRESVSAAVEAVSRPSPAVQRQGGARGGSMAGGFGEGGGRGSSADSPMRTGSVVASSPRPGGDRWPVTGADETVTAAGASPVRRSRLSPLGGGFVVDAAATDVPSPSHPARVLPPTPGSPGPRASPLRLAPPPAPPPGARFTSAGREAFRLGGPEAVAAVSLGPPGPRAREIWVSLAGGISEAADEGWREAAALREELEGVRSSASRRLHEMTAALAEAQPRLDAESGRSDDELAASRAEARALGERLAEAEMALEEARARAGELAAWGAGLDGARAEAEAMRARLAETVRAAAEAASLLDASQTKAAALARALADRRDAARYVSAFFGEHGGPTVGGADAGEAGAPSPDPVADRRSLSALLPTLPVGAVRALVLYASELAASRGEADRARAMAEAAAARTDADAARAEAESERVAAARARVGEAEARGRAETAEGALAHAEARAAANESAASDATGVIPQLKAELARREADYRMARADLNRRGAEAEAAKAEAERAAAELREERGLRGELGREAGVRVRRLEGDLRAARVELARLRAEVTLAQDDARAPSRREHDRARAAADDTSAADAAQALAAAVRASASRPPLVPVTLSVAAPREPSRPGVRLWEPFRTATA